MGKPIEDMTAEELAAYAKLILHRQNQETWLGVLWDEYLRKTGTRRCDESFFSRTHWDELFAEEDL